MPEEINRILTDSISDAFFVHSPDAVDNLVAEGIPEDKIHSVGNVMIDSLSEHLDRAETVYHAELSHEFPDKGFGLVTLHRPSNVDDSTKLAGFLSVLDRIASDLPLVFPIHPRTRSRLDQNGFAPLRSLRLVEPMGYLEFLGAMKHARIIITDSGGIQEEASFLNVPCVTARDNTERPITVELGSNVLAGSDPEAVLSGGDGAAREPEASAGDSALGWAGGGADCWGAGGWWRVGDENWLLVPGFWFS